MVTVDNVLFQRIISITIFGLLSCPLTLRSSKIGPGWLVLSQKICLRLRITIKKCLSCQTTLRSLLFRPHLWGRNYILKWVLFVQTILADRYIHRREIRVVSLKSLFSVEFETKMIFLNFVFFR